MIEFRRSGGVSWMNGKESGEIRWLRCREDIISYRNCLIGYSFFYYEPIQRLHVRNDVIMKFGACYLTANSILDELETTKLNLGETK